MVPNAPYGVGETSANLWLCSSVSWAQGAFHTCAREKRIWHEYFSGTLTYEKQNEFARGDCKKIRTLHFAKPISLMELYRPYYAPFPIKLQYLFSIAIM